MKKLYFVEISDIINADKFERLLSFVSKEKQEEIKRFHFDIDKKLSLYAELIVRMAACKTLGIKNDEIAFEKGEHGKPYLKDYPNFHFNLSHTRNAIAVSIFDNPVGVDIEKVKAVDLQIAKRFFTDSEVAYITKTENETDKLFYEVWTKKEAYIKYIGKGLSMPLNSFNVLDETISKQIETFKQNDYIISVCSEKQNQKYNMIELSENESEYVLINTQQFFVELLFKQNYIYAWVDNYYISTSTFYNNYHDIHPILVHGYNKQNNTYNAACFEGKRSLFCREYNDG